MSPRVADTSRPLLVHGGPIRTQVPGEEPRRWVRFEDGRVTATGPGEPPEAPDAARIELGGRLLLPGFCDAHAHLGWIAASLLGCDLSACGGVSDLLETFAAYRGPGRGPGAEWLVGFGFDESAWSDPRLPARAEIDAVESRRPVLLQRVCGHVGVLNGPALAQVPDGPHTDRETGRIAEDDLYAVNDLLRPRVDDLERVLPEVVATLHAHGITSVHDVTSPEMLAALGRAAQAGRLAANVSCSIPARYLTPVARPTSRTTHPEGGDPLRFFEEEGFGELPVDRRDVRLRVLGIKLFVDGSLGARTAYLRTPYADDPRTRGAPLYETDEFVALVRRVDAAGLQLMVHAIGDAALDQALDVLEPLLAGGNPHRHRIEHAEVTPPDLVERLARSRLHACVQPNFAGRWSQPGGMNGRRLGAERLAYCNAYRTLHEAGVPLAFGSDCMPLGPLFGLRSAVAHPVERERLGGPTAVALYTAAGAAITHAEGEYGRVAPGLRADFAVLDRDPVETGDWGAARVEAVFVGGRQVWGQPL